MKKIILAVMAIGIISTGVFAQEAVDNSQIVEVVETGKADAVEADIAPSANVVEDEAVPAKKTVSGPKGKFEIYGGYGIPSGEDLIIGFWGALANAIAGHEAGGFGQGRAGVNYWVTDNIGLGVVGDFTFMTFEGGDPFLRGQVMPKITFEYGTCAGGHISFYNALALGVQLTPDSGKVNVIFAGDVTVAGIRVKIVDPVSLYAEINAPCGPLLSGGVSFRF